MINNSEQFDEEQVRLCYIFLNHLSETEIRIVDPEKKKKPESFFVHSENEAVEICKKYNGLYNIYFGINERKNNGTTKEDVVGVKTIIIDIDAIRINPSLNPATEEELKVAENITNKIIQTVKDVKQPQPAKVISGNGFQLWFAIPEIKIDNYNRQEVEDKLQMFQDKIIELYDINKAIDKIGDLPRIIKVWGTLNIKGKENIEEGRIYRVAKAIENITRIENDSLKTQILDFKKEKEIEYEVDQCEDIVIENLPPCISYILKLYENKDGDYWYKIIQLLSSFFLSIGLKKEKALEIIKSWNKKQPYHEEGEEKDLELTINRVYKNKIIIPNCKKIKNEAGGFPYFGLSDLKLCKESDYKCRNCINPIIRYKRAFEKKDLQISESLKQILDKKELITKFRAECPFFYDKSKMWWFWNKEFKYWIQVDETDLLNEINKISTANTINTTEKNEIIEAMKQVGREHIPKRIKPTWIQFKDSIIDIKTGEMIESTPKYFITNPIFWDIGESEETPIIDKLFTEWVGEEYKQTLYEIVAYSMLSDYPIHRLFCFIGEGLNGKGTFLRLLTKFIGESNVTSAELDVLLASRFEITRLYKKLVCQMGETNFNEMQKTSILKKLTGQDLIGFEYKNKTPFEDYNYAKVIISTNNLPATTDKTIGFYRRWLIIDFPTRFSEKEDVLSRIPDIEFNNLAKKSIRILKELLEKREFSKEGSIEDRAKKYEDRSDPIEKFIKEFIVEDPDGFIWKGIFMKKLNQWCKENRFRQMSEVAVGKKMKEKGITQELRHGDWVDNASKMARVWVGIQWKEKIVNVEDNIETNVELLDEDVIEEQDKLNI